MAQTGYTPILIYSTTTASQAPAAGNLTNSTLGSELAINITDGKLFYKDNGGSVQVIGWKTTPTSAGGTGLTSYTAGDMLYYASGTALSKLAIGASGYYISSTGTAPQWTAPAALTKTDDTNVTLTLGGSASTALLNAASLTLGWTGQLAATRGGTGYGSYTAGDILYASSTTALSKLAIGTNTYILTSNGSAPTWAAPSAVSIGTASNLLSNSTTGVMQITGPGAGTTRVMTIPNANFTAARTDAAQTFTGNQTFSGDILMSSGKALKQSATNTDLNLSANGTGTVNSYLSNFSVTRYGTANGAGQSISTTYGSSTGAASTGAYAATNRLSHYWNGIAYNVDFNNGYTSTAGGASSSLYVTWQYYSGGVTTLPIFSYDWFTFKVPDVYGTTVGATNRDVYVDSTGVLGYVSSTLESKSNIQDYDDCDWLMQLNPITFNRKKKQATADLQNYPNGYKFIDETYDEIEIGLLADDLEKIRPDMCFYDEMPNGTKKLSGIQYSKLTVPMLRYIQKLEKRLAALEAKQV